MTKAWYPLLGEFRDTEDEPYNGTGWEDGPWDFPGIEAHDEGTWVMKNDQTILIREMGDRHLINTLRLIERMWNQGRDQPPFPPPHLHGETAWKIFEDAWDQWEEEGQEIDIDEFCPAYPDLTIEAKKRKLSWTPGWLPEDHRPAADDLIHHVNRKRQDP